MSTPVKNLGIAHPNSILRDMPVVTVEQIARFREQALIMEKNYLDLLFYSKKLTDDCLNKIYLDNPEITDKRLTELFNKQYNTPEILLKWI